MDSTANGDGLLTVEELARKLRLHPTTVRGMWRRRMFPGLRIGHRTLRCEYPAVLDALRRAGDPSAGQAEEA